MTQDPPPLSLPLSPDAPGLARSYLRLHAGHLGPADLEDAVLMTSELVTNAVEHGAPLVVIQAHFDPPHVTVEVSDGGLGFPFATPTHAPNSQPHGRHRHQVGHQRPRRCR
jgi:anti-sigma regulatory factor (Ser/Thr protein kinase)